MKTCLITGATSGIGLSMATKLLEAGAEVILISRTELSGQRIHNLLSEQFGSSRVHLLCADLSSMSVVRRLSEQVRNRFEHIDVLINNASCVSSERRLTEDGFELQFAVNYLAPVLLTYGLLPSLMMSEQGRIINVNSRAHGRGTLHLNDLGLKNNYSLSKAYNQSKLAKMHFSITLAKLLRDTKITVNSFHPGLVNTTIGQKNTSMLDSIGWQILKKLGRSPLKASEDGVFLSFSEEISDVSGGYFHNKRQIKPSKSLGNAIEQEQLWRLTMEMLNIPKGQFVSSNQKEITEHVRS
jgi:NAD(P)-dependent dehydrogenase (short-subunit alcohol dehydrogenase family)